MASKTNKRKPTTRKPAPKAKKANTKRPAAKAASKGGKTLLSADLAKRLAALAKIMNLSMEALTVQALREFAETWEEHHRTMQELQDDDRIQLSVKPE